MIGDQPIAYNGLFLILIHILTIGACVCVCVCVMVVELVEFRLDGRTDIQVSVSCAYGVPYSKFILLRILTKFIQTLLFKNISVGSESRLYRNTILV